MKLRRRGFDGGTFGLIGISFALLVELFFVLASVGLSIYGIVCSFQAHVIFGILSFIAPLGLIEGFCKLFLNFDVALAIKAFMMANGVQF